MKKNKKCTAITIAKKGIIAAIAKNVASKTTVALACLLCFNCFGCASNQNVSRVLVDKNGRLASVPRTMPTFNKGMLTKYGVNDSGETTVQNSALGLTSPDSEDKTYPYRPPVMNSPQMEMQQNLRPADGFKYQPNAQQSTQHQAFMQQNQNQNQSQSQSLNQKPLNQQKSFVNKGGANAEGFTSASKTPNKTLESQYQQGLSGQTPEQANEMYSTLYNPDGTISAKIDPQQQMQGAQGQGAMQMPQGNVQVPQASQGQSANQVQIPPLGAQPAVPTPVSAPVSLQKSSFVPINDINLNEDKNLGDVENVLLTNQNVLTNNQHTPAYPKLPTPHKRSEYQKQPQAELYNNTQVAKQMPNDDYKSSNSSSNSYSNSSGNSGQTNEIKYKKSNYEYDMGGASQSSGSSFFGTDEPAAKPQSQQPKQNASNVYYVRAGTFSQEDAARKTAGEITKILKMPVTPDYDDQKMKYKINIGPLTSKQDAESVLDQIVSADYYDVMITNQK